MTPAVRKPPRRQPDPLVADIISFIRQYVVMSPEKLLAVALWVIHTHCVEQFETTPYLAVTSPEKQCGKSRLLETLELLVARPWPTITPSEAVVFRNINAKVPTMLLDETDTIFNPKTAERYEGLRAILNSGHRRGAKVARCLGTSEDIAEFKTFCPKVLAGIGTLPDTIADRAVPIRLERRKRDEKMQRFFRREALPPAQALQVQIKAWCKAQGARLGKARPVMPDELSDRMIEGCEPLIAIADGLGWGAPARDALVALLTTERLDNSETMRLRLLRDIRDILDAHPWRNIKTADLLMALVVIEEAPWGGYYGRTLESRDLSNLLKPYGISSTTVRAPLKGKPAKGYKRDDFADAWARYLDVAEVTDDAS